MNEDLAVQADNLVDSVNRSALQNKMTLEQGLVKSDKKIIELYEEALKLKLWWYHKVIIFVASCLATVPVIGTLICSPLLYYFDNRDRNYWVKILQVINQNKISRILEFAIRWLARLFLLALVVALYDALKDFFMDSEDRAKDAYKQAKKRLLKYEAIAEQQRIDQQIEAGMLQDLTNQQGESQEGEEQSQIPTITEGVSDQQYDSRGEVLQEAYEAQGQQGVPGYTIPGSYFYQSGEMPEYINGNHSERNLSNGHFYTQSEINGLSDNLNDGMGGKYEIKPLGEVFSNLKTRLREIESQIARHKAQKKNIQKQYMDMKAEAAKVVRDAQEMIAYLKQTGVSQEDYDRNYKQIQETANNYRESFNRRNALYKKQFFNHEKEIRKLQVEKQQIEEQVDTYKEEIREAENPQEDFQESEETSSVQPELISTNLPAPADYYHEEPMQKVA